MNRFPSMALAKLATSIPFAFALVGCQSAAIKEVRDSASSYESMVKSADSRVHYEETDEFLDIVGEDFLELAEAHASARTEAYEATRGLDRGTGAIRAPRTIDTADLRAEGLDPYDDYNVYLVHSHSPNAATPGDNCAEITTRLFLELDRPEHVYAVIAHEIGHVVGQHQIEQVVRRQEHTGLVTAVSILGATADAYNASVASQSGYYYQPTDWSALHQNAIQSYRPWRKEDEFEADRIGLELYCELGLDPEHYAGAFEKLMVLIGDEASETHPQTSQRIERIRQAITERGLSAEPRQLDQEGFRQLQESLAIYLASQEGRFALQEDCVAEALGHGAVKSAVNACGSFADAPAQARWEYQSVLHSHIR
jgi:peptidase M48-like protein